MKVYFLTSDFSMLSRCFNHWKNGCFVVLWIGKEKSEYFTGKYTLLKNILISYSQKVQKAARYLSVMNLFLI